MTEGQDLEVEAITVEVDEAQGEEQAKDPIDEVAVLLE